MNKSKKICFILANETDYNILKPLLLLIQKSPNFSLFIIICGENTKNLHNLHFIKQQLYNDKFSIYAIIFSKIDSQENVALLNSFNISTNNFYNSLNQLDPDLIFTLGNNIEILSVIFISIFLRAKTIHLYDQALISYQLPPNIHNKVAHLILTNCDFYFVSNAKELISIQKIAKTDNNIFNVGSIGLDTIKYLDKIEKDRLFNIIKFQPLEKYIIFNFNINFLSFDEKYIKYILELILKSFTKIDEKISIIFLEIPQNRKFPTLSKTLNTRINKFVKNRNNCKFLSSIDRILYINILRYSDLIIGNSLSGIIEASLLKTKTISLIENKNKDNNNYLKSNSTVEITLDDLDNLVEIINTVIAYKFNSYSNPYGDGNTSEKIISYLDKI